MLILHTDFQSMCLTWWRRGQWSESIKETQSSVCKRHHRQSRLNGTVLAHSKYKAACASHIYVNVEKYYQADFVNNWRTCPLQLMMFFYFQFRLVRLEAYSFPREEIPNKTKIHWATKIILWNAGRLMMLQATWSILEAGKSFLPWLHPTVIESKSLENTFKIIKSSC